MKKSLLGIIILLIIVTGINYTDDLKGYFIPEYYVVGSHHDGEEGIEGQHGLWLRRVYFGYNTKLGDGWSARVRFEMNSKAFGEDKIYPYIKNLHLKKKLGGGANLIFGIMEPPSFNKVEKFWGFRYIEKTAPDFFKFASSRDFGIMLDGKTKGGLVYSLMYGNYSSNKSEDNKGKAIYGRLGYESKSMYVEANGHTAADGSKKYTFLSLFGGMKGGWGRFGIGYNYKNQDPEGGEDTNSGIISAFGVFNLGKKAQIFARYDHLTDLNLKDVTGYIPVPADYKARFVIAGLNFKIHKMIQISPNVKYVMYDGDNAPDSDFYFNLTAKIGFKTSIGKK